MSKKALPCASCALMDERNENNEEKSHRGPRLISLTSCNSFFSLFVSIKDPAVESPEIMPLTVSFGLVLAFHPSALSPGASIPVVPTGHCRGWRVAPPPRPLKNRKAKSMKTESRSAWIKLRVIPEEKDAVAAKAEAQGRSRGGLSPATRSGLSPAANTPGKRTAPALRPHRLEPEPACPMSQYTRAWNPCCHA